MADTENADIIEGINENYKYTTVCNTKQNKSTG